jgi:hypothetical protein
VFTDRFHVTTVRFGVPVSLAPVSRRVQRGQRASGFDIDLLSMSNCTAEPYLDTGLQSDLARIKRMFPDIRRAVLLTPGEVETAGSSEFEEARVLPG